MDRHGIAKLSHEESLRKNRVYLDQSLLIRGKQSAQNACSGIREAIR